MNLKLEVRSNLMPIAAHRNRFRILTCIFATILAANLLVTPSLASVQIDIHGPEGSSEFGTSGGIKVLPNGNFVVNDYEYEPLGAALGGSSRGAVYLYNGANGNLISTLTGSVPGDSIGLDILVLPSGDFLVQSKLWNQGVGALTFCSGVTGCSGVVSEANSLVGTTSGDNVGENVQILSNGNYVNVSFEWDSETEADVGAVTFCNAKTGCVGTIISANSLVGEKAQDRIGVQFAALDNGNYVVGSPVWDNGALTDAGAAKWCSGTSGCTGFVTTENSIYGGAIDTVGQSITPLSNGRYAVISYDWNFGGIATDVGAVTFCSSPTGCVGEVQPGNSLTGQRSDDSVGIGGVYELTNGNVVVVSQSWVNPVAGSRAGAVTFCSDLSQCSGIVSNTNSLIGSRSDDRVGSFGVLALANGNYVVQSPEWQNFTNFDVGAATFCSGTTGCTGNVTTENSLYGTGNDSVGRSGLALPNGNYAVISPLWEDGAINNIGAVTFCNGETGCSGEVSQTNSLTGIFANNQIGSNGNVILANGNFVIRSQNAGSAQGAVTFCSGTMGCPTGQINATNSLFGKSNTSDRIGRDGILALDNGNYVVLSSEWDKFDPALTGGAIISNLGAATLCNGISGCMGSVDGTNSLIGTSSDDYVGLSGTALGNNYVVGSRDWDRQTITNAGAVTFCEGNAGCVGEISQENSLVGSTQDDFIGNQGLVVLPNDDYLVVSNNFHRSFSLIGGKSGQGAVTFGNGKTGLVGEVNNRNSVFGTNQSNYFETIYDEVNDQVIIGRESDHIVTLFRYIQPQPAPFDFDGDGITDISVFRPSTGIWYVDRTNDGFLAVQHGLSSDVLTPADYDGDGRTDVAVWRPGAPNEASFFILNSSDFSLRIENFGQTGDDPVVVGDWDGDGLADPAVYRDSAQGSQSFIYYLGSENNPGGNITFLQWGTLGDKPVRGDFDGDGKLDLAIFRPSEGNWYIQQSSDNAVSIQKWGISDDKIVPGDYDGDAKTDLAVYRPSEGIWYILRSSNGQPILRNWGISTDQPTPGDYDGDGRIDFAIYRPGDGVWYILENATGNFRFEQFGLNEDIAIPSSLVGN